MKTEKRRTFIKKSAMASAGIALGAPAFIEGYARINPSDILNVGVIGINDRGGFYGGGGHTANFTKIKDTRVTAICDCVEYLLPKAVADIEKLGGAKPALYTDYRKMLENKDLDIISIATPDYWHATTSGRVARWSGPPASMAASSRSAHRTAAPPRSSPASSTSAPVSSALSTSSACST